jgi:hypothetical protein
MARSLILGTLVAGGIALAMSDATVFGIDAWKVLLALAGLALFVLGGRT